MASGDQYMRRRSGALEDNGPAILRIVDSSVGALRVSLKQPTASHLHAAEPTPSPPLSSLHAADERENFETIYVVGMAIGRKEGVESTSSAKEDILRIIQERLATSSAVSAGHLSSSDETSGLLPMQPESHHGCLMRMSRWFSRMTFRPRGTIPFAVDVWSNSPHDPAFRQSWYYITTAKSRWVFSKVLLAKDPQVQRILQAAPWVWSFVAMMCLVVFSVLGVAAPNWSYLNDAQATLSVGMIMFGVLHQLQCDRGMMSKQIKFAQTWYVLVNAAVADLGSLYGVYETANIFENTVDTVAQWHMMYLVVSLDACRKLHKSYKCFVIGVNLAFCMRNVLYIALFDAPTTLSISWLNIVLHPTTAAFSAYLFLCVSQCQYIFKLLVRGDDAIICEHSADFIPAADFRSCFNPTFSSRAFEVSDPSMAPLYTDDVGNGVAVCATIIAPVQPGREDGTFDFLMTLVNAIKIRRSVEPNCICWTEYARHFHHNVEEHRAVRSCPSPLRSRASHHSACPSNHDARSARDHVERSSRAAFSRLALRDEDDGASPSPVVGAVSALYRRDAVVSADDITSADDRWRRTSQVKSPPSATPRSQTDGRRERESEDDVVQYFARRHGFPVLVSGDRLIVLHSADAFLDRHPWSPIFFMAIVLGLRLLASVDVVTDSAKIVMHVVTSSLVCLSFCFVVKDIVRHYLLFFVDVWMNMAQVLVLGLVNYLMESNCGRDGAFAATHLASNVLLSFMTFAIDAYCISPRPKGVILLGCALYHIGLIVWLIHVEEEKECYGQVKPIALYEKLELNPFTMALTAHLFLAWRFSVYAERLLVQGKLLATITFGACYDRDEEAIANDDTLSEDGSISDRPEQ